MYFIVLIAVAVVAYFVGAIVMHFENKKEIQELERYHNAQKDKIFSESFGAGYKEGIAEGKRQQQLEQIQERKRAQN